MAGIKEKLTELLAQGEWAMYIKVMEEYQQAQRVCNQRTYIKSLLNNTLQERKEILYDYLFVTVNPSSESTFQVFEQLINKATTKKWMTHYVYVIEQRGQTLDELGKGFHLHLILKKPEGKVPSHIVRELASTFKKVCDTSNFHFFNTKWISEEEYRRKLKYLLGQKEFTESDRKDLKQQMDIVWREKMNIKKSYGILGQDGEEWTKTI